MGYRETDFVSGQPRLLSSCLILASSCPWCVASWWPIATPCRSTGPYDQSHSAITRDVLRDTTSCAVRHGSTYEVPHEGQASEQYAGSVSVDRRTFAQQASADCTYRLRWPGIDVSVSSSNSPPSMFRRFSPIRWRFFFCSPSCCFVRKGSFPRAG